MRFQSFGFSFRTFWYSSIACATFPAARYFSADFTVFALSSAMLFATNKESLRLRFPDPPGKDPADSQAGPVQTICGEAGKDRARVIPRNVLDSYILCCFPNQRRGKEPHKTA